MRRRTLGLVAVLLLAPVAIGGIVYFGAPLGLIGWQSVQRHRGGGETFIGIVAPDGYAKILANPLYRRLLGETFRLAGACAVVCLLAGFPVAWAMRLGMERLKRSAALGAFAPTLANMLARSLGWLVVLGEFGLVNLVLRTLRLEADLARRAHWVSELAELGGMIQVFFPFMVLALYGALAKIDLTLLRAARNLGASPARAFLEIVVPLSLPAAVIGVVSVFALATGAYVTVATMGGGKVRAMAESAYAQSATLMDWQLGAAALALALVSAVVLLRMFTAKLRRPGTAPPVSGSGTAG